MTVLGVLYSWSKTVGKGDRLVQLLVHHTSTLTYKQHRTQSPKQTQINNYRRALKYACSILLESSTSCSAHLAPTSTSVLFKGATVKSR